MSTTRAAHLMAVIAILLAPAPLGLLAPGTLPALGPALAALYAVIMPASVLTLMAVHRLSLGLERPARPVTLALLALCVALAIQSGLGLIEPWLEAGGLPPPRLDMLEGRAGDKGFLLVGLIVSWLFAALPEEIVFRAYLMGELTRALGPGRAARTGALVLSAALFGLCHAYQGLGGIMVTGAMGLILGLAWIATGQRLWLPILIHGFVDSLAFIAAYRGAGA